MSLSLSFGFVLKKFSMTLTNTWSLLPPLFWWLDPSSVSLRTSLTIWSWNLFPVSLYQLSCTWTFHDLEFCHEIMCVCVLVGGGGGGGGGGFCSTCMFTSISSLNLCVLLLRETYQWTSSACLKYHNQQNDPPPICVASCHLYINFTSLFIELFVASVFFCLFFSLYFLKTKA